MNEQHHFPVQLLGTMMRILIAALLMVVALPASADQKAISSYGAAGKKAYGLYVGVASQNSTDIYCGIRFKVDPADIKRPTDWLSLEHAYPADWMADQFGCDNRETCRRHPDPTTRARFNHAEGDLHNLWPALVNLNSARGKRPFAELGSDEIREVDIHGRIFKCKFHIEGDFVEPRQVVRGNLARSIFYMCAEYGFPVEPTMMATLRKWNRDDPPTQAEKSRAEKIRQVQGTRNTFIANPALGDGLQCGTPAPQPERRPPQAPD